VVKHSPLLGFYYFTSAVSAAIGEAFVSLSNDPLLIWNYGSVAIIAFVGGIGFWLAFRKWDKQEEALNMLPESTYIGNEPNDTPATDEEKRP
jgi:POT family proton-dependent oligopeptide transporter